MAFIVTADTPFASGDARAPENPAAVRPAGRHRVPRARCQVPLRALPSPRPRARQSGRSEEHTSELQSLMRISYAVFCLKKNNKTNRTSSITEKHKTKRQYTI